MDVYKTEWFGQFLFNWLPDCSQCLSAITTSKQETKTTAATPQTTTATLTATSQTSSEYPEPGVQESGKCLDNQGISILFSLRIHT